MSDDERTHFLAEIYGDAQPPTQLAGMLRHPDIINALAQAYAAQHAAGDARNQLSGGPVPQISPELQAALHGKSDRIMQDARTMTADSMDNPWQSWAAAMALGPSFRGNKLSIQRSPTTGVNGQSFYDAMLGDQLVGRLSVHPDNRVGNVFVFPEYQRQGVARQLYEHAARDRSVPKLSPGDFQTPEGRALRDAYEGGGAWKPHGSD